MLYEFRYEANGHEGTCQLRGNVSADPAELFREWWTICGDPLPSFWLVGCWAER